ncbi:hypothetical protein [Ulvibacterium sp.]|uniref:hypothetical protein n=1 Tax=Ulvibacterium sp. TaxID=2665914 RepID=UPI00260F14EA|nr:hypothetical protein [Ulvibacterium sp.]
MKRVSFALIAFALGSNISCTDETTVYQDKLQDDIVVENSESELEGSIALDDAGVLDIFEEEELAGKSSKSSDDELAGDHPLTLIARIKSPSSTLGATHVDVQGNYAYVSYNTADDTYLGAIDIVDVRDPNRPRLRSRLTYRNADVNSLVYADGHVYVVGGVDAETSVRATSNSFIAKISVSNARFNIGTIIYGFQQGKVANDVAISGNSVLVSSGSEGSVTMYDRNTLEILDETPFADLRSVSVNEDKIAVLDADQGIVFLDGNLEIEKEIPVGSDFPEAAKRTLDFYAEKMVVAEGEKGAGVYDAGTGNLLQHIPLLDNTLGNQKNKIGIASDNVTNAVAVNDDILLMANGSNGLCLSQEESGSIETFGIIALEGSINYVESKGDYIFAASGLEGLQILKLNRPSESLVERCAELPSYQGSANLNVNGGETLGYRGSKRFNRLNVNGSLLLCGSWTANNNSTINSNGLFEMNGTFVIGRNNKRKNIIVNSGAVFRVEGNLTIYGDLILNDGATIEFIGDGSVVNIFGRVRRSGNTEVKGTFSDIQNKF